MNRKYFISGIDTDCGKTFITGKLAFELLQAGKKVITHKIVQTGCKGISDDIVEHRKLMQIPLMEEDKQLITCPEIYSYPASPHFAAKIDNRVFNKEKVLKTIGQLTNKYELQLIEGVGGLMVPLTTHFTVLDFIKENDYPLLLVCSSQLGSINHSLMSIEICRQYDINLKAIIYNQFPQHDTKIAQNSFEFLEKYLNEILPNCRFVHSSCLHELIDYL